MSGGKGGESTTKVKLPKELAGASKDAIELAKTVGQIGFMPFSGPAVAAFTPQQTAAFNGAQAASDAFGISGGAFAQGAGLPAPTTFAGGVRGYSAMPLYEEALAAIPQGQREALMSLLINPNTGAAPTGATQPAKKRRPSAMGAKGGFGEGMDQTQPNSVWWN